MTSSSSGCESPWEIQNEEWTIRYQELKGDNLTKALLVRAGRLGCLLLDKRPEAESAWQHTRKEMMVDSIQQQVDQQLSGLAEKISATTPAINNSNGSHQVSDVDVDAFFDEYPECIRIGWVESHHDGDSSSDEEEEALHISKENKPPLDQAREAQRLGPTCPPPSAPGRPSPSVPNVNPYQRHQPTNTLAARSRSTTNTTFDYPVVPRQEIPPSWDSHSLASVPQVHPAPRPTTTWEEHSQQQNPFLTAREMARVMADDDQHARADFEPRHSFQQLPQPPDETTRGRNSIPESLRRKFQPPKRVAEPIGSQPQRKQAGFAPSAKGGVQPMQRPQSSSGRSDEGQDEELPEELQHLDKELVKKIEHEIMESGDTVTFDDIAGLDDAKQTVQEVVCWPMKRPDLFTGLRRAPNGLLLYGPPGTGKTLIGKAIAHESGATFFSISSSSLTSKWIGEGEKLVKTLFAVAAYREPAVVFIDEIDSLLTQRKATENEASRRIKTEFLVQLDGTGTSGQGRVLVIGATNKPQELDEAARRRFTKRLYIPLPVESDRRTLLQVMLKKNKHELTSHDIDQLAKETHGFSGADLKALCTDAAMGPIRQLGPRALEVEVDQVPPITFKHFKRSLKGTKPSVAPSDLLQYEEWDKIYGSKRATDDDDDDDDADDGSPK